MVTYDVWDVLTKNLEVSIETFFPDPEDIAELLAGQGPNLFYASVANRKACCNVRKVRPLPRALAETDIWIASLRRQQGPSRSDLPIIARSEQYQLYKIHPLANWSEQNVWTYIRNNAVPYNRLYDKGFLTIGCAPCTRPVRPAEDPRSGRWWWEKDEHKECGIHVEGGRIFRRKPPTNFQI